ncbi:MAG: nucleic acid/nucleotide deaminase domain-containing protein [Magnetospirillum sp.]|nr:nucleic acid/nucleotide deaminase domain-containing protein [Magnetospirillum sp.]
MRKPPPPPPTRFAPKAMPAQPKLQARCGCAAPPPGPPPPAWRPPAIGQCASEAAKSAGHFLWKTSGVFKGNVTRNIMEVQSTFIDGKLVIAANDTPPPGADGSRTGLGLAGWYQSALDSKIFDFQRDKHTFERYRVTKSKKMPANITFLTGYLHAEQQLLLAIAKKLASGTTAGDFVVMGTKRPCSICHRVLRAFASALGTHYPGVHLHYVDRTGANTNGGNVGELDGALAAMKDGTGGTFDLFADQYATDKAGIAVANYYDGNAGESNSVRTNAVPQVSELT